MARKHAKSKEQQATWFQGNPNKKREKKRKIVRKYTVRTVSPESTKRGQKVHDLNESGGADGIKPQDTVDFVPQIKRYDEETFHRVTRKGKYGSPPISIPSASGSQGSKKILRKKKKAKCPQASRTIGNPALPSIQGMINVDKCKLMDGINECIRLHAQKSKDCQQLEIDMTGIVPWGVTLRCEFKCKNCTFLTPRYRLYDTVESSSKGAKAAISNVALGFGLQDTPIGNERARCVIGSTGVRPGSRRGMQKISDKVAAVTVQLQNEDEANQIEQLKDILEARGLGRDAPIAAEFDVRYDGASHTTSYHPGSGASCGLGIVHENMTDQKRIIGSHIETKLCYIGARMRNAGKNVQCPGHAGCSATIKYSDVISEGRIAKKIGKDLVDKGMMVSHFTSDSDGRGPIGMQEAMADADPTFHVIRMKDTVHLGKNQKSRIMRAKLSTTIFGPDKNAEFRKKGQTALSFDIPTRCAIIHQKMFTHQAGDIERVIKYMPRAVDSMINCYRGDHTKCRYNTFAQFTCRGYSKTWFQTSHHLSGQGITHLDMSEDDEVCLRNIINLKLGEDGLRSMKQMFSTQKSEGAWAGISTSLPKNRRFSKSVHGRFASAKHRLNNGPMKSMNAKLKAGKCSFAADSPAMKVFEVMQRRKDYHIEYKHRTKVIQHKRAVHASITKEYYAAAKLRTGEPEYLRFLLDKARNDRLEAKCRSKRALLRERKKALYKGSDVLVKKRPASEAFLACQQNVKRAKEVYRTSIHHEQQQEVTKDLIDQMSVRAIPLPSRQFSHIKNIRRQQRKRDTEYDIRMRGAILPTHHEYART